MLPFLKGVNKMKKINLSIIAFISSLLLILAVNTKRVSADDNSIMTLGVSLTPNQKKGTINTLNRAKFFLLKIIVCLKLITLVKSS